MLVHRRISLPNLAPAHSMRRIPELDAIRGLAALGVVLYHAYPYTFFLGWSCVDLFFVLSGFLISTIIVDNVGRPGFYSTFYYRRALRIWPIYYLTLVLVLVLNTASQQGYATTGLALHIVFLQNIQHTWQASAPPFIPAFAPSWSVAVEEQFYLTWPFLLGVVGRKNLVPAAVSLVVVGILARLGRIQHDVLLARSDGLALGSVLAAVWWGIEKSPPRERAMRLRRLMLVLCTAGGIALALACELAVHHWRSPFPPRPVVVFPVWATLYASVLGLAVSCTGHPLLRPLRWQPLRWLGVTSYSMYMLHSAILSYGRSLIERLGVRSPVPADALLWLLIFAVPAVTYHLVERPILSARFRFTYESEKRPRSAG
jgi:peptidoglycan/LPS O-acetylase OafA/YrhL